MNIGLNGGTKGQFFNVEGFQNHANGVIIRPPRSPHRIRAQMFKVSRKILITAVVITGGAAPLGWAVLTPPPANLAQQIQDAQTVLERARIHHTVHYDPMLNWHALPDVPDPQARKALFIAKMLPLIAEENERILSHRARIENTATDLAHYNALAYTYGLKPGASRRALLARIDQIPESLALAQAAIESAWGTSRFARTGHAYFGERTYNLNAPGMKPERASGFLVKSFSGTRASVRSFMLTLNSHRAYTAFRAHRAALNAQGLRPKGLDLAPYLHAYSEIGDAYIQRIQVTIRANALSDFDGIEHVDH